jgi:hypothetical protein
MNTGKRVFITMAAMLLASVGSVLAQSNAETSSSDQQATPQTQMPMMGPGKGMMGPCPHMGMGSGMMMPGIMGQGMGPGMMIPGLMMSPGMGSMGPGMMGPEMMGSGMGMASPGIGAMGPGMMAGPGGGMGPMMGHALPHDLAAAEVRHILGHHLAWQGNPNLKLGEVKEANDDTITAEIVTRDGSLVRRFEIDRHTGMMRPVG